MIIISGILGYFFFLFVFTFASIKMKTFSAFKKGRKTRLSALGKE